MAREMAFSYGLVVLMLVMFALALLVARVQREDDMKLCRHTIQTNFRVGRDVAQKMIDDQIEEDR